MAITKGRYRGTHRRKRGSDWKNVFEARIPGNDGKFYYSNLNSQEVGALCYDVLQLYIEMGAIGEKPKAAGTLNFPKYSRTLQLEPLRSGCDKKEVLEIIVRQAQAAAKNLPRNLRRSTTAVGSPSPSNPSSSHQNVHGVPLVAKQSLPGLSPNQLNLQEISDLSYSCNIAYTSKLIEREELERIVAGIMKSSGTISIPEALPDEFPSFMARLKQLVSIDEKLPPTLERVEQGYKSEDSKCLELRKLLTDYNNKVMDKCIGVENVTWGRQRVNEDERLPRVLEDRPAEESNEWGMSVLYSEGYGLSENPLVDVWPSGTDTTTPPAEVGVSQRVVLHEVDKFPDENSVRCETFSVDLPVSKPLVSKEALPGVCPNQLNLQERSEFSQHCSMAYTSEVIEGEMLEQKEAGIDEDSGFVDTEEFCPGDSTSFMPCLKPHLESAVQGYKSEDSKRQESRKFLEDHDCKVMDKCIGDDIDSLGRLRANEGERLPRVLEDSSSEELNECGLTSLDIEMVMVLLEPPC